MERYATALRLEGSTHGDNNSTDSDSDTSGGGGGGGVAARLWAADNAELAAIATAARCGRPFITMKKTRTPFLR